MRDTFSAIDTYYTDNDISENSIISMIIYDMIYDVILPSSFVIEQCIDVLFTPGIHKDTVLRQDYCHFLSAAYKDNKKYAKHIATLV